MARTRTTRSPTHPRFNPGIAVELTMREREALMSGPDWEELIDVVLLGGESCERPSTD